MPDPMAIRIQATSVHPEIISGAVLPGMPDRQGRRGLAIERLARQPLSQLRSVIVSNQSDGLVAQPRAGFDQPPAEVDIFAGPQRLVEPTQFPQDGAAADDRGARHI